MATPKDPSHLYRSHHSIKIGGTHRFIITYIPQNNEGKDEDHEQSLDFLNQSLFVKIKNVEFLPLRAAYIAGPYVLYVDICSEDYHSDKPCFITADQPKYDPNLAAGQSICAELSLHTLKEKYVWVVDVQSQILFSTSNDVHYEIMVGLDQDKLHRHNFGDSTGKFSSKLDVQFIPTVDLWNKPPPFQNDNVHLVVLTHGLHSNSTADMFYLKEKIEQMSEKTGDNICVRAYTGNVCKTERGIKYLGRRVAEWLIHEVTPTLNISKISFIAHSLGGPTQTFAISYIQHNYPNFFDSYQLENLIYLASPLLGISNENPAYVKMALSFGIVGKTGMDLNLQGSKPLLLLLPSDNTRKVLKKFKRRTLYANTLNDGIVPLRTSALVFLDWKGLGKVYEALKAQNSLNPDALPITAPSSNNGVAEIPSNMENRDRGSQEHDRQQANNHTQSSEDDNFGLDDISNTIKNKLLYPVQNVLGYYVPLLQPTPVKKSKKYVRYQTRTDEAASIDSNADSDKNNSDSQLKDPAQSTSMVKNDPSLQSKVTTIGSIFKNKQSSNESKFNKAAEKMVKIPHTNVIESMTNVLLQPTPPMKFLMDPNSRKNVILHDKIYKPDSIPRRTLPRTTTTMLDSLDPGKRHKILEERIARRWHKGMTWRKVLVNLLPDAHNNMVVRRKFANAYGWPVIDHLVEEHFGEKAFKGEDYANYEWHEPAKPPKPTAKVEGDVPPRAGRKWSLSGKKSNREDIEANEQELDKKFSKIMSEETSIEQNSNSNTDGTYKPTRKWSLTGRKSSTASINGPVPSPMAKSVNPSVPPPLAASSGPNTTLSSTGTTKSNYLPVALTESKLAKSAKTAQQWRQSKVDEDGDDDDDDAFEDEQDVKQAAEAIFHFNHKHKHKLRSKRTVHQW
ncbi:unnamed protein product [Ambrosiozyma monospora]|uniref:Unnamed protein product n=1 Tax=Ambrosiozyma monospora TaxID=43982 RepID=A0ACB5SVR1_AMBMO|nr:unnamed protein product [Ambrosiozyma monospora]